MTIGGANGPSVVEFWVVSDVLIILKKETDRSGRGSSEIWLESIFILLYMLSENTGFIRELRMDFMGGL